MIQVSPEVRAALDGGRPVVALESTVLAHGLPRPRSLEVGMALEAEVRAGGAVPATVGVLGGAPKVGSPPRRWSAWRPRRGCSSCPRATCR